MKNSNKKSQKEGRIWALKFTAIGIAIAYIIMYFLIQSPIWIFEGKIRFVLNIIIGAFGMVFSAYFFGQLAGFLIITKKYWSIPIGVLTGILILVLGTIIGSLLGYFQEGISHSLNDGLFDYIVKPLFWVSFFGFIPVLVCGLIYGLILKNKRL